LPCPIFLKVLRQECRSFGLNLSFEGKIPFQLHEGSRGEIERTVAQLKQENATDFVLSVLPFDHSFEDENADENSIYRVLKQTLLRSGIQSQNMGIDRLFEPAPQKQPGYHWAMTNLVLGILAKTGQVPYVLAEPMHFTDFVVGLDISRKAKQRSRGSTNVVAATRVFKNDGNFFFVPISCHQMC
jgi:argonaute-like protein implicated in RNA metabolism and viral defense